jgi:hypothetical protein
VELLELIQVADSAQQVLSILATYLDSLRGTTLLPESLFNLPLDNARHVEARMVELMTLVTTSSRALDHRRVHAAKQALHVFAIALWKLRPRRPRR